MAYTEKEIEKAKAKIIDRICNGKSLKSILDSDNKMPSRPIVYTWLNKENDNYDKEFFNNYVRATQDRADYLVEEIITIADDQEGDTYEDDDGKIQTNHNVISRSKLRVDSRKWIAGKMRPKKYGDKLDVTTDGEKITTIPFLNNDPLLDVPRDDGAKEN